MNLVGREPGLKGEIFVKEIAEDGNRPWLTAVRQDGRYFLEDATAKSGVILVIEHDAPFLW
jgi:hypothetical protein